MRIATGTVTALTVCVLLGCGGGGSDSLPATLVLTAVADAFVCNDDWASINHGTDDFSPRAVGQQNDVTGNQIGRMLYRFDASAAWSGSVVTAATLRLKLRDNIAGFPVDTAVLGFPDNVTETGVTWDDMPTAETPPLDTVTADCCGIVYDWDVTAYVNAQLGAADVVLCFEQRGAAEGVIGGVRWWQREGDGVTINLITGEAPRLILTR